MGLHSGDGFEHLADVIGFGLSFGILDIDAWVALPGSFIDEMTAAAIARGTEVVFAYFREVAKADPLRITAHVGNDFFNGSHAVVMVSLVILLVKRKIKLCGNMCNWRSRLPHNLPTPLELSAKLKVIQIGELFENEPGHHDLAGFGFLLA